MHVTDADLRHRFQRIEDWLPEYVRWYCGVSSRSELDTNEEAATRWRQLYSMFTADMTYGEVRR